MPGVDDDRAHRVGLGAAQEGERARARGLGGRGRRGRCEGVGAGRQNLEDELTRRAAGGEVRGPKRAVAGRQVDRDARCGLADPESDHQVTGAVGGEARVERVRLEPDDEPAGFLRDRVRRGWRHLERDPCLAAHRARLHDDPWHTQVAHDHQSRRLAELHSGLVDARDRAAQKLHRHEPPALGAGRGSRERYQVAGDRGERLPLGENDGLVAVAHGEGRRPRVFVDGQPKHRRDVGERHHLLALDERHGECAYAVARQEPQRGLLGPRCRDGDQPQPRRHGGHQWKTGDVVRALHDDAILPYRPGRAFVRGGRIEPPPKPRARIRRACRPPPPNALQ